MDRKAINKAASRLDTAKQLLLELRACKAYPEFCSKWYLFLVSAKNVYTTLEKGARANAKTKQWWFAEKKAERKDDPLLQYMFQARDDDEHGLEPVTEHVRGSLAIGVAAPGYSSHIRFDGLVIDSQGRFNPAAVRSGDGLPVRVEITPEHVRLIAVTGRGDIKYQPPTEHMGKPIGDASPAGVATLTLAYLSRLLDEARARAA